MFGLSMREKLTDAIISVCEDQLGTYKKALNKIALMSDRLTDKEIEKEFEAARKGYLNSVFGLIWNGLDEKSPIIGHRIRMALCAPEITGLPPEFTIAHFDQYGVSAGATYAICYYAIKNKPIKQVKDYKNCSRLNYIQAKATDLILNEIKNSIL